MMQVEVQRAMMVKMDRPTFFMVAADASASGKLDRKTPTTKTRGFLEPLRSLARLSMRSRTCAKRGEL